MKRILRNNQYWYVCLCGFECSGSKDASHHNYICGASTPTPISNLRTYTQEQIAAFTDQAWEKNRI